MLVGSENISPALIYTLIIIIVLDVFEFFLVCQESVYRTLDMIPNL